MSRTFFRASGRHYRFRAREFWAQDGFIRVLAHDKEPPEEADCHTKDFLERALQINREISRISYGDERSEFQNLVENMIECAKEAGRQGALDDPRYLEWASKHRPYFNSSILVPGPSGAWTTAQGIADETKLVVPPVAAVEEASELETKPVPGGGDSSG